MPKWQSGSESDPDTGITATATLIPLLSAHGAITTTIPMRARLMATTDRAGSWVDSLLAPARGITGIGVAVDIMAAEATTAAVDTTAELDTGVARHTAVG